MDTLNSAKKTNSNKKNGFFKNFLISRMSKMVKPDKIIGVTGTIGKSTAVICINSVLNQKLNSVIPYPENLKDTDSYFLNSPMAFLKMGPKVDKAVIEISALNHGQTNNLLKLLRPWIGVVTRLSFGASEHSGVTSQMSEEKAKLIESLPEFGFAVLNWDDLPSRRLADKTKASVVYFGSDRENSQVWSSNPKIEDFQTIFELNYGVERVEVKSRLLGFHQISSMMAAAAVGVCHDIPLINIKKGLEKVEPLPGRMQPLVGHAGSIVINDTYEASLLGTEESLETLNLLPARRRVVVLGELSNFSNDSEKIHRQIARQLYKDKVDFVITGQGDSQFIADELIKLGFLSERILSDLQTPQIISSLLKILGKGDMVLIKGSPVNKFEEVVKRITKVKAKNS